MAETVSPEEWLKMEEMIWQDAHNTQDVVPFTFDKVDRKQLEKLVGDEQIPALEKAISVVREVESRKSTPPKHSVIQSNLKSLANSLSKNTIWFTGPSSVSDRYLLHEVKARYRGSEEELQIVAQGLLKLINAMQRASKSAPFIDELVARVQNEKVLPRKGGRRENKMKKRFAWRIFEIFTKTGKKPTFYRGRALGKVLAICVAVRVSTTLIR